MVDTSTEPGAARCPERLPPAHRAAMALFIILWCSALVLLLLHSAFGR